MQTAVFVYIPLLIVTYMMLNGLAMAISPLKWARARWTAKGQCKYDEVARQVAAGKTVYWRVAGICIAVLSVAACILTITWATQR
jgi:hypothetical protein